MGVFPRAFSPARGEICELSILYYKTFSKRMIQCIRRVIVEICQFFDDIITVLGTEDDHVSI